MPLLISFSALKAGRTKPVEIKSTRDALVEWY